MTATEKQISYLNSLIEQQAHEQNPNALIRKFFALATIDSSIDKKAASRLIDMLKYMSSRKMANLLASGDVNLFGAEAAEFANWYLGNRNQFESAEDAIAAYETVEAAEAIDTPETLADVRRQLKAEGVLVLPNRRTTERDIERDIISTHNRIIQSFHKCPSYQSPFLYHRRPPKPLSDGVRVSTKAQLAKNIEIINSVAGGYTLEIRQGMSAKCFGGFDTPEDAETFADAYIAATS